VRALASRPHLGDDDLVDERNIGLNVERLGGQIDESQPSCLWSR
jgi:hypothetical protein